MRARVCPEVTYHSERGNYHKYLLKNMTQRNRLSLNICKLIYTAVTNSHVEIQVVAVALNSHRGKQVHQLATKNTQLKFTNAF